MTGSDHAGALVAALAALSAPRRRQVLTHRRWAERVADSNERLELLGDAVLQLIVTEALLERHPEADEGDLAWMRQGVVGGQSCAAVARAARLDDALREAAPTDSGPAAIVASERVQAGVLEALIGAIWLDLGPEVTREAVLEGFAGRLDAALPGIRDPKTSLQEAAAKSRQVPRYELLGTTGPPHAPMFETRVLVGEREVGRGAGPSKQASEVAAATAALAVIIPGNGEE